VWCAGQPVGLVLRGLAANNYDRVAVGLCAILAGGEPDGLEASVFWRDLLGDPAGGEMIDDLEYAAGFVTAALAIWDAVRDRVDTAD
jgi:hypothetical protein